MGFQSNYKEKEIVNKRIISILTILMLVLTVVFSACTVSTPKLSVIYDRTHIVYEGDTLDSLKPYLTVKYTDANGDRKTILNGYTLTGNLNLGENSITVKYKDATSTFSVTVVIKPQPEPEKGTFDNPYTVTEALQLASALDANAHSESAVYVKGVVYGDITKGTINDDIKFEIIDDNGEDTFTIYYATLPPSVASNVDDGDTVVVYGYLYKYVNDDSTVIIPEMADYNGVDCTVVSVQKGEGSGKLTISISAESSIEAGTFTEIYITTTPASYQNQVELELLQGEEYGYLDGNMFHAFAPGKCVIVGKIGETVSNQLVINVTKKSTIDVTITLSVDKTFIERNEYTNMTVSVTPSSYLSQVNYRFIQGENCATRIGNSSSIRGDLGGIVMIQAYIEDCVSNVVSFQVVNPADDPYTNTNSNWFHTYNYAPADSLEDSYWRTKHNLMSGSIADQDQAPTTATNQPKSGNMFIRNTDVNYIDNGNTYCVVDSRNNVVNKIYKFGAYVTLEDVAAYVYAFGDVPANYTASNKTSALDGSPWGKYLRLNHTYFSGDNSRYPYEPALPRISGIGNGDLRYYEIDIGTTGTDCDPSYDALPYNTGTTITRGAARIVYSRYYRDGGYDGEHIDNLEERYVFYTYNHYNDFQEYLNYQGGWGQIFGNITGGGTISSKSNYNPTPYVNVSRQSFNYLF